MSDDLRASASGTVALNFSRLAALGAGTPGFTEPEATPEPSDLDRVVALAQALLNAGMNIDALLWRMMRLDV